MKSSAKLSNWPAANDDTTSSDDSRVFELKKPSNSGIDPEFNKHQVSEAKIGIQKLLDEPEELQSLRDSNSEFEVMTKEEIYDSMVQGPENFYNAKSTMILSLLALLLLATLNSIFVAIIYRKVVFKDAHSNLLKE